MLVVSKLGAGRAGCFCALSLAYVLLTTDAQPRVPEEWEQDNNILDHVSWTQSCSWVHHLFQPLATKVATYIHSRFYVPDHPQPAIVSGGTSQLPEAV